MLFVGRYLQRFSPQSSESSEGRLHGADFGADSFAKYAIPLHFLGLSQIFGDFSNLNLRYLAKGASYRHVCFDVLDFFFGVLGGSSKSLFAVT